MNDKDKHITTTEKVLHNQTTADGKENTVTVVLIVLVLLLLMMLLIGVVIVYLWKTRKICYEERDQLREGIIIKYLTFLTTSYLSPFLILSVPYPLKTFLGRILKQTFSDFCRYIIVLCAYICQNIVPSR